MMLYLQLDINTVAAGGGSKLMFRSGMFVVGPESAGANPGPVCYAKGDKRYNGDMGVAFFSEITVLTPI